MTRVTIDFGIDLGVTDSCIAVVNGTEETVIKNNFNLKLTPSVVRIDPAGELHVGEAASKHVHQDPTNTAAEFKLRMGHDNPVQFARSGRVLQPEELSAEILKSLKADVRHRMGEELRAAVITVPAAFDLAASEATGRAAELAGIPVHPLVHEPIAAAMAYGLQDKTEGTQWLVYDLGKATFEASVVQVRGGNIEVVHHGGDNFLGGELIDWAIVEQLLIPEVARKHHLADFRRSNEKYALAIAKLKIAADEAKIALSESESSWLQVDSLFRDDKGDWVPFEYRLERQDLRGLAEPFIVRSINICRKVLEEVRLPRDDVDRILMVGPDTTLIPYLQQFLLDPVKGLGIPLDYRVDPVTILARGAARYARTLRLEPTAR